MQIIQQQQGAHGCCGHQETMIIAERLCAGAAQLLFDATPNMPRQEVHAFVQALAEVSARCEGPSTIPITYDFIVPRGELPSLSI